MVGGGEFTTIKTRRRHTVLQDGFLAAMLKIFYPSSRKKKGQTRAGWSFPIIQECPNPRHCKQIRQLSAELHI